MARRGKSSTEWTQQRYESFVKKSTSQWNRPQYQAISNRARLMQDPSSERELRRQYSQMRAIAEKRVKALKTAGFEKSKLIEGLPIAGHFEPTRALTTEQLPLAIQQISSFLGSELSLVSGQKVRRKQVVEGLAKQDYGFVQEENLDAWIMFITMARSRAVSGILYSQGKTEALFTKWVNKGKLTKRSLAATFREYEKKYYSEGNV